MCEFERMAEQFGWPAPPRVVEFSRMNPMDEIPRFQLAMRLAGVLLQTVDDLAGGPGGRHLRRAADSSGVHLLGRAQIADAVVWTAPALADLLRALRAACPARTCDPCQGPSCKRCGGAGYLPARPGELLTKPHPPGTLPAAGDVSDLWGWVRTMERGEG